MFCRHCGKEIPEGGVCHCEGAEKQRAAEQTAATVPTGQATSNTKTDIDKIIQKMVSFILSVPNALKQIYREPCSCISTSAAIVLAICSMLLQVFACMCFYGHSDNVLGEWINEMSNGIAGSIVNFEIREMTAIGALCGVITYMLTSVYVWMVNLILRLINREKKVFRAALQSTVAAGVFPSLVFFIAGLCFIVKPIYGILALLLVIFTAISGLLNMINTLRKKSVTAGGLIVCGALIALIVALIALIDGYCLVGPIASYYSQGMQNIFDALGSFF